MISAIYAALCGLMLVFLSICVIKGRVGARVAYGDNDDMMLRQRCRAQANFVEYTPIFLLLLVLAEMHQLSIYAVHVLGLMFLVGRVCHAYGFLKAESWKENGQMEGNMKFRQIGMVVSFLAIIVSALSVLWLVVSARGLF